MAEHGKWKNKLNILWFYRSDGIHTTKMEVRNEFVQYV